LTNSAYKTALLLFYISCIAAAAAAAAAGRVRVRTGRSCW